VPRERRGGDVHVRKQRKRAEQLVELVVRGDVEHADVGVAADHAPQMCPAPVALQRLGEGPLAGLEVVGLGPRHVRRQADLHLDEEEHQATAGSRSWSRR
jgi:hypothetical protein